MMPLPSPFRILQRPADAAIIALCLLLALLQFPLAAQAASTPKPVRVIVQRLQGEHIIQVRNELDRPVTAVLKLSQLINVDAMRLPILHKTIPAGRTVQITRLRKRTPGKSMNYRQSFSYSVQYGPQPESSERDDHPAYLDLPAGRVAYEWPWIGGPFRVSQGPGGGFSHTTLKSRYAVDIPMPVGTPVVAARDGIVIGTRNSQSGRHPYAGGNSVRIRHKDGTHAVYLHLRTGSVRVRSGQRVQAGTPIAESGNTGRSTGPHLHFVVQRSVSGAMRSIPFQFRRPLQGLPNLANR